MKKYSNFAVMLLTLVTLYGCATTPKPIPRDSECPKWINAKSHNEIGIPDNQQTLRNIDKLSERCKKLYKEAMLKQQRLEYYDKGLDELERDLENIKENHL
jgi:hypothetical protein